MKAEDQVKKWQNTFAPHVENRELTVNGVIALLRFGALDYEKLPIDIRDAVDEEIAGRKAAIKKKDK